nr:hypothetical protein Q903MT_gene2329 [Picea sitchensis]
MYCRYVLRTYHYILHAITYSNGMAQESHDTLSAKRSGRGEGKFYSVDPLLSVPKRIQVVEDPK